MFLFLLLILGISEARPSLILKNKTTLEFNIYKDYMPYIAEEFSINRSGFTLDDPVGHYSISGYKTIFGVKYSDADFIKIDPHWYISHRRINDWKLDHGPALRFDITF